MKTNEQLNKVIIAGRVTQEVKAMQVANVTKVVINIAVNRSIKKGDQWIDVADYFQVDAWQSLANYAVKACRVGSVVVVEGHLKTDKWEKDGQKKYKLTIVADNIEAYATSKKDGTGSAPKAPASNPAPYNYANEDAGDDYPPDIPF